MYIIIGTNVIAEVNFVYYRIYIFVSFTHKIFTMGIENTPLMNEKCIELAESDNWNRSPSLCNSGLSVAWKNLTVTARIEQQGFFKKAKTKYKDILRNVSALLNFHIFFLTIMITSKNKGTPREYKQSRSYSVQIRATPHPISGAVEPTSLVAILGASGSGKSTLMSILANRNPGELSVRGKVTVGGTPIGKFTKYVSGFVYQDDLFVATLTVMEHLNFMARLRLDKQTTESTRKAHIIEILTELGLMKVANSRIGTSKFGNQKMNLSGGERKRLSIATELITDPSLLFCDEPTTGLDAFTALKVISSLRDLVNNRQKTIICSIHQPSEKIFELFDQIILLSGGKIAFSGTISDALIFFTTQGYIHKIEKNEADFLIRSLAKETQASYADDFCSAYEKSDYYKRTMDFVDKEINKNIPPSQILMAYHKHLNEPSWGYKLRCITERNLLHVFRDGSIQRVRLIQKLFLGFLIGLCMHNTITPTQAGMQALKGAVFFVIGQNFFPAIHVALNEIPKSLPIFFREYSNNTTSPSLFYLSHILSMLPGFTIDPLLFTLLVYFMINLASGFIPLFLTCLLSILVFNTSATFGLCMSLVFPRLQISEAVTTPIINTLIFCSGVYIKLSSIPAVLRWLRFVSWLANAIEALFIVQLSHVTDIECPTNPDLPCLGNKQQVLATYDFHEHNLWGNMLKIISIYFLCHICAYIGLLRKVRARKIKS